MSDLATLEAADQADRAPGPNKIDWAVVGKHDSLRRACVLQLLSTGSIRTSDDFLNAAVIFQHGDSIQDTQLAFAFATTSARMDPSNRDAKILMAQAWDRILTRSNKPQWYGTQYVRSKTTGKWMLYPIDPNAVTDAQRTSMGLPTLAEAQAMVVHLNN